MRGVLTNNQLMGHSVLINTNMALGYCSFPYAYSFQGSSGAQPSNIACQELAGVDSLATTGSINLPLTNQFQIYLQINDALVKWSCQRED